LIEASPDEPYVITVARDGRGNWRTGLVHCHKPILGLAVQRASAILMGTFLEPRRVPMQKKYIVRLSQDERRLCEQVVDKLKGTSQKVRRANILLKADADG